MKTNSVKITVDGSTYDSLTDFKLAIENTDCIGTPVRSSANMIEVPGRDGLLDMTDTVFGGEYFTSREIKINFGGLRNSEDWDSVISNFRNLFEGKTVKVEFATMPGWYFTGRCTIEDFGHVRALGTFVFTLPDADPYMYKDISIDIPSDPSGVDVDLAVTRKTIIPTFIVITKAYVRFNDTTYEIEAGTHQVSEIRLTAGTHTLKVASTAMVTISYRDGSL